MKLGVSFSKRFTPAWNHNADLPEAERLTAILSMPKSGDLFAMQERMKAAQDDKAGQVGAFASDVLPYLQTYVKLEGAEDFTIENVAEYPMFFELALELLGELIKMSQPTETDVKNS